MIFSFFSLPYLCQSKDVPLDDSHFDGTKGCEKMAILWSIQPNLMFKWQKIICILLVVHLVKLFFYLRHIFFYDSIIRFSTIINVPYNAVFALILFTYLPESQIKQKKLYLFKQILS